MTMFRTLVTCSAAAFVATAAPAAAQSPFDGTWKADAASAKVDAKPDQIEVRGGMYSCATCLPPISVKADGAFHAVKDRPYWDEIAVQVLNDRTVLARYRKDGRVVGETRRQVSEDGNQMTISSINTNNAAELPITATSVQTRAGAVPAGAHGVSGLWKAAPASTVSDAAITMTIRVVGDRLNLTTPTGETLDATFGGAYALNVGNPAKMMTKAERLAPGSIRLTDMVMGKVTGVSTYTIAADGTTLNAEWVDPRDGAKGSFVARKQP